MIKNGQACSGSTGFASKIKKRLLDSCPIRLSGFLWTGISVDLTLDSRSTLWQNTKVDVESDRDEKR